MGILKSLFGAGKKDARRESPGARAQPAATGEARLRPGHSLAYDPDLIASLKDDHQDLVHIFQRIDTTCRTLDFPSCMEALKRFRSRFTDHLIVENTRFYLYVKHAMEASDPASAQLARDFQHEMHQIARVVTSFVDKYSVDEEALKNAAFGEELQGIGRALAQRIEREEKALYPLYAPVA